MFYPKRSPYVKNQQFTQLFSFHSSIIKFILISSLFVFVIPLSNTKNVFTNLISSPEHNPSSLAPVWTHLLPAWALISNVLGSSPSNLHPLPGGHRHLSLPLTTTQGPPPQPLDRDHHPPWVSASHSGLGPHGLLPSSVSSEGFRTQS